MFPSHSGGPWDQQNALGSLYLFPDKLGIKRFGCALSLSKEQRASHFVDIVRSNRVGIPSLFVQEFRSGN